MSSLIEKNLNNTAMFLSEIGLDKTIPNYIGGEFSRAVNSEKLIFSYSNQETFEFAIGNQEDVLKSIDIAEDKLKEMRTLTSYDKSIILDKVAEMMEENKQEIAALLVFETGKSINDAVGEVNRSISTLKFTSMEVKQIKGETLNLDSLQGATKRLAFTKVEPLGVIGAITGFNFPILLGIHKIAPALGAGNTVILKPSPKTPISSIVLAKFFEYAGLPKGALSVINGNEEIGREIINSDKVKAISFTGSSQVGKKISEEVKFKKVLLELGSNAATIIDTDKELDTVAKTLVKGGLSTNGQSCISVQRIIVNEMYKEELLYEMKKELEKIKIGNPFDESVSVSALINPSANERILSWINEAENEGAQVVFGGEVTGSTLQPTLLSDVSQDMKIFCEEIFGPVMTVTSYESFEEAIELTNHSNYGLQVGVHTESLSNSLQAIDEIESGSVHINETSNFRPDHMPYGGVKDSGIGKEGPKYVIDELTTKKVVSFKL